MTAGKGLMTGPTILAVCLVLALCFSVGGALGFSFVFGALAGWLLSPPELAATAGATPAS